MPHGLTKKQWRRREDKYGVKPLVYKPVVEVPTRSTVSEPDPALGLETLTEATNEPEKRVMPSFKVKSEGSKVE